MKIIDLLDIQGIDLYTGTISNTEVIDHLIALMQLSDQEIDKQEIIEKATKAGEETMIFYVPIDKEPKLSILIVRDDSLDSLAKLFFLIAVPKDDINIYLTLLLKMLRNRKFEERLISAQNSEEFIALVKEFENKIENSYDLLFVDACKSETRAMRNLMSKAKEMNISFKVEIDDLEVKEELEKVKCVIIVGDGQVEMSRFDGKPVILIKDVESDKAEILLHQAVNEEIDIFHYQDKIKKTIKPNRVILKRMFQQLSKGVDKIIPVLVGSGALISIATLAVSYNLFGISSLVDNVWIANSYVFGNAIQGMIVALLAGFIGQTIAKQAGFAAGFSCGVATQLNVIYLNDVNNPGLLGGIVAGFIGGYAVIFLQRSCKKISKQFDEVKSAVIYPLFSIIFAGMITYLISPYIGIFNHTISNFIGEMNLGFKLILGMAAGAMMAIGGPVNKIGYIFGVSQILEGNFDVMAAIMAAGMAPALAIAFATTLFENKFSIQEKKLGRDNSLMGFAFVSKGILPFIQKEPQLVTVTCIIASVITGGLSMVYNCGVMVPCGGIFVLPLIAHPLRFLIALLAGMICGGTVYGLWREAGDE